MKYFLDFDRTIFDTPAFKKSVARRPSIAELFTQLEGAVEEMFGPASSGARFRAFRRTLGTFLSHGRFLLTPEELKGFLYPDVSAFLAANDCTIVTYGVEAFIRAKVASALTDLAVTDVIYTRNKKGPVIRRLSEDMKNGPFTYVDDAVFQLVSVARYCPNVRIYEMRRDGLPGDGRWPVARSLADLPG